MVVLHAHRLALSALGFKVPAYAVKLILDQVFQALQLHHERFDGFAFLHEPNILAPSAHLHGHLFLATDATLRDRLEAHEALLDTQRVKRALHLCVRVVRLLDLPAYELCLLLRVYTRALVHAQRDQPQEQVRADHFLHVRRCVYFLDCHRCRDHRFVDRRERLSRGRHRIIDQVVLALRLALLVRAERKMGLCEVEQGGAGIWWKVGRHLRYEDGVE